MLKPRQGDFLGNARVVRCRYSAVFTDVNGTPWEGAIPVTSMAEGLHGIDIGQPAIDAVLGGLESVIAQGNGRQRRRMQGRRPVQPSAEASAASS